MSTNVDANGRSILHKGHGQTHTCAVPDVCKTPSPGGPVPIPYVNIAMDSNITNGAGSVKIEGNPVANVKAKISTSTGDEPGSAGGGIMSSKIKGTVTWKMGSLDVKAEGKSVVRFLDTAFHNGNSFNTSFIDMGGTGLAYADDFDEPCPICRKGPKDHRVLERKSSADKCAEILAKLRSEFNAKTSATDKKMYCKKDGSGYMVGVMICPCGTSFAAMSGKSRQKFDEVAGSIVDKVISGGGATSADFANANTSTFTNKLERIQERWDAIDNIRTHGTAEEKEGYNAPGSCAGAKLLAKSGHCPVAMTEMFFVPPWEPGEPFHEDEPWSARYDWLVRTVARKSLSAYSVAWRERILQNKQSRLERLRRFDATQAVASCHSCQELLYLTMCPKRTCS